MSHLDAGILHALLDGEIPSRELPPIQAHLAACAECRARLEEERQLLAESESLVGVVEVPAGDVPAKEAWSASRSPVRLGRSLAWAATVIASVGVGYLARGGNEPLRQQEVAATFSATDSDTAPAVPAPLRTESAGARKVVEESASRETGRVSSLADRRARNNAVSGIAQERKAASQLAETMPVAAAAPPPSTDEPLPAAKAVTSAAPSSGLGAQRALGRLRDASARVDQLQAAETVLARPEPISFPDAVRRLAGSLRLIDGLVPLRLEAQGLVVRVVYVTAQGELVLSQQLIDGRVEYHLIAPAGFPADSLARLKARVRE